MNKVTARIAAEMLQSAESEFSNHGCNDFELDNTPENQAFIADMETWNDPTWEGPINTNRDGTKIYTMDWFVMAYCAYLLKQEADKPE